MGHDDESLKPTYKTQPAGNKRAVRNFGPRPRIPTGSILRFLTERLWLVPLDSKKCKNITIKRDKAGSLEEFQDNVYRNSHHYKDIISKFNISKEHPGLRVSPVLNDLMQTPKDMIGRTFGFTSWYHLGPRFFDKPLNEGTFEKGLACAKYAGLLRTAKTKSRNLQRKRLSVTQLRAQKYVVFLLSLSDFLFILQCGNMKSKKKANDEGSKKQGLTGVFRTIQKKANNILPSWIIRRPIMKTSSQLSLRSRKNPKGQLFKSVSSSDQTTTAIALSNLLLAEGGASVPLAVVKCIEAVELNGLQERGIYRAPGNYAKANRVLRLIANNDVPNLKEEPAAMVATLLKKLLRTLSDPLVPKSFTDEHDLNDPDAVNSFFRILAMQPAVHRHTLAAIIMHFKKVIANEKINSMTAANLSICAAHSFFDPAIRNLLNVSEELKVRTDFFTQLLDLPTSSWEEILQRN
ncbi:hypothetical protein QR680_001529 [Steinernema hermaphroditum]|uniref:Rho-GAP domain-containing protein n=1 Tax=Steinernema hermaphroditum TaxID=289476 RepID=A0AA39GZJ1_9BILA|nr:hypothetical protein QR680_001529 [Steinernema hermaphroditum]